MRELRRVASARELRLSTGIRGVVVSAAERTIRRP